MTFVAFPKNMAEESIYNWCMPPESDAIKPDLYHSKYDGSILPKNSFEDPFAVTSKSGSIGRDLNGSVSPTRYLRSHEKTNSLDLPSVHKIREYHHP